MRPRDSQPSTSSTRRGPHLLAMLVATIAAALLPGGSAPAATAPVTVTVTVPSAISLTNNCTTPAAYSLGTVLPGSSATTTTGAGVCSFTFQSSNDSAMLRLGQRDGTGTAMGMKSNNWTGPAPDDSWLGAIAAYDANNAMAVGRQGMVRRTTNGGASWTEWTSVGPVGGTWWTGVAVVPTDINTWWVVGSSGNREIIRTQNGMAGSPTWTSFSAQLTAAGWPAGAGVSAICSIDANTAIVVGSGGWIDKITNAGAATPTFNPAFQVGTDNFHEITMVNSTTLYAASEGSVYKTTTGGGNAAAWSQVLTGSDYSVAAGDATHVYAAGDDGYLATSDGITWTNRTSTARTVDDFDWIAAAGSGAPLVAWAIGDRGSAFKTIDGGVTWNRVDLGTSEMLLGAAAVDATHAFVVGTARVSLTTTDGTTWTKRFQTPNTASMYGITTDPSNGQVAIAVGGTAQAGVDAQMRRTTNGGGAWASIDPGVAQPLFGVSMGSSQVGWAVGDNGTILATANAGVSWSAQASPTTQRLRSVAAYDAYTAYAVGANGTVVKTTNGITWNVVATPTTEQLYGVSLVDANTLVVVGGAGTILTSTNGGSTWTSVPGGNKPNSTTVLIDVSMADASTGYAKTSHYNIWKTTNGGANWSLVAPSPSVWTAGGLDTAGDNTVLFTGDWSTVISSSDAGSTWSSSNPTSNMIGNDVAAVDPNTVYVVGTGGLTNVTGPNGSANATVSDYGAGNNWGSAATTNMFGVCLQGISAQTTAQWTLDTFNTAGKCEALDSDPWYAIPASPTKVAYTVAAGAVGRADVVWGFKASSTQTAGRYRATVVVEALAPNV